MNSNLNNNQNEKDEINKSIVETLHENKKRPVNLKIQINNLEKLEDIATPKSTVSIKSIGSLFSIPNTTDFLDLDDINDNSTQIDNKSFNSTYPSNLNSSFSSAVDKTLKELFTHDPYSITTSSSFSISKKRKRSESNEFEVNKKIGFSNIHDDEDKENYIYLEWDEKPVEYRSKYGVFNDERQEKLVKELLEKWIELEIKGPKKTSDEYQIRLLRAVRNCCISNQWIESKEFLRNNSLYYNFFPGDFNQTKSKQNCNRAYNDHRVFFDPKLPFVTRSRSQCIDSRFLKQNEASKRWKKRQLRINPVYIKIYKEIQKNNQN